MPSFRYSLTGTWFKGNTHIHSVASDGGKTFAELAQIYHEAGYDFLFRTDHWVCSDARAERQDYPILWLDGVELDGVDRTGAGFHVVALGTFNGLERSMGLEKALEAAREQGGMLILAHPQWMGNSFEDALRWNFDGVEVYNHICRWLNGKGDGSSYWNAVLRRKPHTLALAVDDAHINPGEPLWNGGWVMVNAAELSPEAIFTALRAGQYYSTCGPEIHSIQYDGERITVQCSPVQFARLVGPAYRGERISAFEGPLLSEVTFKVPGDWNYIYLELEDAMGRRAWSNTLFGEG